MPDSQFTPEQLQQAAGSLLQDRINPELLDTMKNTGLAALGVGAGVRGAQGLYNLVRRNLSPPPEPDSSLVLSIPTARKEHAPKFAAADAAQWEQLLSGSNAELDAEFHTSLKQATEKDAGWLDPLTDAASSVATGVGDRLKGVGVQSLSEHPLAGAGILTAGAAGLLGGYKLTDTVLNARRQIELDRQEDDAKNQYEQALQQLVQPPAHKRAEDTSLAEDLSRLYALSKQGSYDWSGALMNAAITSWPVTAGLTGALVYNMSKNRQQNRLLDRAVARRQRQQLFSSPMYAYPDFRPTKEKPTGDPVELDPETEAAISPGLGRHAA